jgi:hypothetical protein
MEPYLLYSRSRLLSVVGRHASDGVISIGGSYLLLTSLLFAANRLLNHVGGKRVGNKAISI